MNKIKFLNAFAGFGGNTELLDRNKFEVTHVEIAEDKIKYLEDKFPNDIILKKDAWQFLLDTLKENYFDIYWFSPVCTTHSSVRRLNMSKPNFTYVYPDFRLYSLITLCKHEVDGIWIVENVRPYYELPIPATAIVGRHLIWSNRPISKKTFPADQIIYQADKDMRKRMKPEIGLYIVEQAMKYQQQTLEEFHE